VEDIVFAQTLSLLCGRFEVAWDDLCLGLDGYTSSGVWNELRNPGAQTILHLNCLREHRLNGWPVSPGHVLETLRDLTVTEPRDKMYAAMSTTNATAPRIASNTTGHEDPMQCLDGISPPEGVRFSNTPRFQHPSIEPRTEWIGIDYRKTYEQACIDTAEALNFNKDFVGASFFSLSMVGDSGSQRLGEVAEKYLSSWMPDWRSTHQVCRLNTTESTFRACNDRHGESAHVEDRFFMAVQGCIVYKVDKIASSLPPRRWNDKYNTSGANSFFFWEWMKGAHEISEAKYKGQADR
jgi:hypothetical protein